MIVPTTRAVAACGAGAFWTAPAFALLLALALALTLTLSVFPAGAGEGVEGARGEKGGGEREEKEGGGGDRDGGGGGAGKKSAHGSISASARTAALKPSLTPSFIRGIVGRWSGYSYKHFVIKSSQC